MKQLAERIGQLKKEEDIVLFARFYVDENENVADSVGDYCSLEGMSPDSVPLLSASRKSAQEEKIAALRRFAAVVQKSSKPSRRQRTTLGARDEFVQ